MEMAVSLLWIPALMTSELEALCLPQKKRRRNGANANPAKQTHAHLHAFINSLSLTLAECESWLIWSSRLLS
jgi:hypothetical protein